MSLTFDRTVAILLVVVVLVTALLVGYGYTVQWSTQSSAYYPLQIMILTHNVSSLPIMANITSGTGKIVESDLTYYVGGNASSSVAQFSTATSFPVTFVTTRYFLLNVTTQRAVRKLVI